MITSFPVVYVTEINDLNDSGAISHVVFLFVLEPDGLFEREEAGV